MTAFDDAREAVGFLREGADDYLVKPIKREEFEGLLLRIHERLTLISESFLPPEVGPSPACESKAIVYRSAAMARLMSVAARCADSRATVLVSGESGTGKELVARFFHQRSQRRDAPFVAVNLSALSESLAESEIFGHKRGAFTRAEADRIGRFEEADYCCWLEWNLPESSNMWQVIPPYYSWGSSWESNAPPAGSRPPSLAAWSFLPQWPCQPVTFPR